MKPAMTKQRGEHVAGERECGAAQVLANEALFRYITSFMLGVPKFVLDFAKLNVPQHERWLAVRNSQNQQLPQHNFSRDGYFSPNVYGMLPFIAIKEGDMRVLKALYELQKIPRYRSDSTLHFHQVAKTAVQYGRLGMLKWLHERKERDPALVWNSGLLSLAIRHRHVELMDWIYAHCPRDAVACGVHDIHWQARVGNLEVLKWLHGHNYDFSSREMDEAAKNGHLDDVRFLHEHRSEGCTTDAMDGAAANGHLEIVRFLHRHRAEGCTAKAMESAAENGHFEIVQFLHQHYGQGCCKCATSVVGAAVDGDIDGDAVCVSGRLSHSPVHALMECVL